LEPATWAGCWARGGHQVIFGSRDPGSARVQGLAKEGGPNARAATVREAFAESQVVVLATPWGGTQAAPESAGDLEDRIVVDCTNPLTGELRGLTVGHTISGGELVAGWAAGARVVKAFNSVGAGTMADPAYGEAAASLFMCGDDAEAKAAVSQLAVELGFDVVDAGPLTAARYLEPLAMLWIHLAYVQGMGPNVAFGLLRR
jgi:predicted dinucleotide-binding enzyme